MDHFPVHMLPCTEIRLRSNIASYSLDIAPHTALTHIASSYLALGFGFHIAAA
jgi:hypothetical protein